MTDRDVMERVGRLLRRALVPLASRKEHYKTPYAVTVKGVDAVRLMVLVRPGLGVVRQAQIEAALSGWGTTRARWSYAGMTCAAKGCDQPAETKGLCDSHFNRWYKATRRGASTDFAPRPMTAEDVLRVPATHARTSDCDLTWLAGLLEGEGSFSRSWANGHNYPVVSLHMCSKDIVDRAAVVLRATGVYPETPRDPSWNTTYRTKVTGAAAAAWMQRLRSMMGERRRAAIDAALDAYYPEGAYPSRRSTAWSPAAWARTADVASATSTT